ncbi:Chemoreceptor glutamine deamidase CheD [Candidatus Competibacter denitrificans Run_A_D11]|uniref:Probable chemoreceptor glutamine deamidase CheD n=1 Tax=Candidatus Competibacter denitrificans Run_A_D11 TaxID=1400863 RepID=W6M9W4_9GAMM|nr:chemoreceptor glutamine deamidase CheD [Candidatus Competibacter denitrificans]CDI02565.1 Chemoreceptor glutamine deamidase CheD [Candidatus Competibacter denitrificans Run_A_D11]HAS86613.1 chemoreceptor glutamine deamidase CheD [Candidatus Competibacteraceae bacterium]HRC70402.1 chemoreceptor glutamine deamidase CheD [Candidatus Competibacter denitrificans]
MRAVPAGQKRIKHLRLPEFTDAKSYWDPIQNVEVVRILAGEYYVTHCEEMITTVLGSCISVCIRDKAINIGGMNHFMLPEENRSNGDDSPRRLTADAAYGSYAMERLINCILKYGGRRENLEIKIFGGGRIIGGMTDIGQQNIAFVRSYLRTERLAVLAEDVGGDLPRRMAYLPVSGKVLVKKLRNIRSETIIKQENVYREDLRRSSSQGGDVELFGDFG